MSYAIRFKNKAAKELRKIPSNILPNVVSKIDSLAENPRPDSFL